LSKAKTIVLELELEIVLELEIEIVLELELELALEPLSFRRKEESPTK
jgi:hypothetical protein